MFDVTLLDELRKNFDTGITKSIGFRKEQLTKLRNAIKLYENELHAALYKDLKKSPEECWVTETGFMISEINYLLQHLSEWMAKEKHRTNLLNFPSKSYVISEPLGVVLIIGPWNYPLQLLFNPLAAAIAAGNCVVIKSSEFAPVTSDVMKKIISEIFPANYVLFTEGDGAQIIPAMMNHFRFNHVFYTGSTVVGKIIYKLAAEQLTPVTLELGGKSPCVIEKDANLAVAARRVALTKYSNAGQMCVAPDYILVHESVKQAFVEKLTATIKTFFSEDAMSSYNYGKIINTKQFNRLVTYLSEGKILLGGKHDISKLFIEPTVVDNVSLDSAMMKEEIFGPILPIFTFKTMDEAKEIIARNPDPLAFYLFTSSSTKEKEWAEGIAFGGGCINNCSWHLTNPHLQFGGRGNSGIGAYHGKSSFDVFSHKKALMHTPTWFDPSVKYPPFKGKLKLFKWIIR